MTTRDRLQAVVTAEVADAAGNRGAASAKIKVVD